MKYITTKRNCIMKKRYVSPQSEVIMMKTSQFLCESIPQGQYNGGKVYAPKRGMSRNAWQEDEDEEDDF